MIDNQLIKIFNTIKDINNFYLFLDSVSACKKIDYASKEERFIIKLATQVDILPMPYNYILQQGWLIKIENSCWLYTAPSKNNYDCYALVGENKYYFPINSILTLMERYYINSYIDYTLRNLSIETLKKELNISDIEIKKLKQKYEVKLQQFKASRLNSTYYEYYENGNKKLQCQFKKGLLHGTVYQYYENGNLRKEVPLEYGITKGLIKSYDFNKELNYQKYITPKILPCYPYNNQFSSSATYEDLFKNAVALNWEVLEFVPEVYKTQELCINTLYTTWKALKYFPSKYRTKEVCEFAIKQDIQALKEIPNKFITKELSENFINLYPKELKYIPERYRSKKICEKAFAADCRNIRFIPKELINENMCKSAINVEAELIKYIPTKYLTPEICENAISSDWETLKYIPDKMKTESLCIKALHKNWESIKYIPGKLQTPNICKLAVHKNYKSLEYIKVNDEQQLLDYMQLNPNIYSHLDKTTKEKLEVYKNLKQTKKDIEKQTFQKPFSNAYLKDVLNSKVLTFEDEINTSKKYKGLEELIPIEEPLDKIFNFIKIKNSMYILYPELENKISQISKSSTFIKISTHYPNINYKWLFRQNNLEITLEINKDNKTLCDYFESMEKYLKEQFDDSLIIGETKTKTYIYLSKFKYTLNWATTKMYEFMQIITPKLNEFYENNNTKLVINKESLLEEAINDIKDNTIANNNFDSQINVISEFLDFPNVTEGKKQYFESIRYERNPKNRELAIKIHGSSCLACGFNFNDFYGKNLAKGFIEVHHIKPVSKGEYIANPSTDLVPLCPNCHRTIHRESNPPTNIEEIINRYK